MDFSKIVSVKGETEAEGLSRGAIAAEVIFAARRSLPDLRNPLAWVETRKCVMAVDHFLEEGAIANAFAVEEALLALQIDYHGAIATAAAARAGQIRARL